jgi:hypothetical protein
MQETTNSKLASNIIPVNKQKYELALDKAKISLCHSRESGNPGTSITI